MPPDFIHSQHAHCESGVTTNLYRHQGMSISEPMVFGMGSGIFFGHVPFIKVGGAPGTTFRLWPGAIFMNTARRLKVKVKKQRFRNIGDAMDALNHSLDQGRVVGLQTSVYYLPYLPEAFRFHFNAHNLVVYGREGNTYLISDPVMEEATRIERADLEKARFAKGTPEPRGFMYSVESVPDNPNYHQAIIKGIRQSSFLMLSPPIPYFGVKGIAFLGRQIRKYPIRYPSRRALLYLGNIIRMQEEIGTGGGGFRFLKAAFLQEAAALLGDHSLHDFSGEMTSIGDHWRAFAYEAARVMRFRAGEPAAYEELGHYLQEIAGEETSFFKRLGAWAKAHGKRFAK